MAGIGNINNIYNPDSKRITNRLSFQLGETFLASIITLDEVNEEVLLRLMDGWQFPAKLKNPLDFPPSGLIKFQVDGFEDGKLNLIIINDKNSEEKLQQDSIENILENENIVVDKDEYSLLENMVKHNIPLTKENISEVKTLINFINKTSNKPSEEETFINKYAESRGINLNSPQGEKVEKILKGFFSQLKELDQDSILTLLENNVDLTEDNVKSFNKVFKESMSIYKSLEKIKNSVEENKQLPIKENSPEKLYEKTIETSKNFTKENIDEGKKASIEMDKGSLENLLKEKPIESHTNKIIDNKEKLNIKNTEQTEQGVENKLEDKNIFAKDVNIENKKIKTDNLLPKKEIFLEDNIENLSHKVKMEINNKIEEMKDTIKTLLKGKDNTEGKVYDKIVQLAKQDMNNFKIFNTISNEYYYMDIPMKVNKGEYQCKLIIKDERKKGKKIDSKNVKIATSVKTVNMGVVDAFISVSNSNMNVDIKCGKSWIKVLDSGKDRVLNALSNTGYNVYIKVEEKKEELNLISCREFFDDKNIGAINVRV